MRATNAHDIAEFITTHPGHYQGRTTHVQDHVYEEQGGYLGAITLVIDPAATPAGVGI